MYSSYADHVETGDLSMHGDDSAITTNCPHLVNVMYQSGTVHAETGDLSMYDDDSASEVEMEAVADGPAPSQAQVQARLEHASVAQSGPTTTEGQPSAVPPHQSVLRRFSKDHAVSEDIQKRFMIAVENDEKAAKKRVQEMLVSLCFPLVHSPAPALNAVESNHFCSCPVLHQVLSGVVALHKTRCITLELLLCVVHSRLQIATWHESSHQSRDCLTSYK